MSAANAIRPDVGGRLPVPLPREFSRYTTSATGLAGKCGVLEVAFEARDGRTRLTDRYQQPPLQIMRPLYYDLNRPDLATVMIMQLGGGMLQGDRYRIDITCHKGAAAHITTQSANKLYRCEEGYIAQTVTITAAAGSVVEYLPDLTIPYAGARFFGHMDLRIDPAATVIVGEVMVAGRTARGEHHAYDAYITQLHARDLAGRLLVADTFKSIPGLQIAQGLAQFGPFAAFGVVKVFTRQASLASLCASLREALAAGGDEGTLGDIVTGVSELPNDAGVCVRMLGATGSVVERARSTAWNAARQYLLGVPAFDVRKG